MGELTDRAAARLKRRGFTGEDIDRARRFGHSHAALYGYLLDDEGANENAVMTPDGQGTLRQVFSDEARVVLTRGGATESYSGGKPYKPMQSYDPERVDPA